MRGMLGRDDSEKPVSEVLKIAFEALTQHEKQIDKLIIKLATTKEELSTSTDKLSASLEKVSKGLLALENTINKLKGILQT